jgi:hypothetical protein
MKSTVMFAQHHAARDIHRLFVLNTHTERQFLIDSDAEMLVIPPGNNTARLLDAILTTVNDTPNQNL